MLWHDLTDQLRPAARTRLQISLGAAFRAIQTAQEGMLRNGDARSVVRQIDAARDQLAAARRLIDEASSGASTVAAHAAHQGLARSNTG